VAAHDRWPAGTRARFTTLLPESFSPRFGGTPPVLVAHAVVSELYQCPFEDLDTDVAGAMVKGTSDAQVRGYMINSGPLMPALVSEWLCSAMSPALRLATLLSIALAIQRVVNKAMDAAGASKDGVASAAASVAAAAAAASATGQRRQPRHPRHTRRWLPSTVLNHAVRKEPLQVLATAVGQQLLAHDTSAGNRWFSPGQSHRAPLSLPPVPLVRLWSWRHNRPRRRW